MFKRDGSNDYRGRKIFKMLDPIDEEFNVFVPIVCVLAVALAVVAVIYFF